MTPETIQNAKLIASVLCRVVDYYAARTANVKLPPAEIVNMLENAERNLAVAIENVIDAEALS